MFAKRSVSILVSFIFFLIFSTIYLPVFSIASEDTVSPQLTSAALNDAILILSYDEALDTGSVPAVNDFSVNMNGTDQTDPVNNVTIGENQVTITLNTAAAQSDIVLLSYVPGISPIKDLAGNQAAALTDQQVMNNTAAADTTAPMLTSATIVESLITVSYNESLDPSSVPAESDFTVKINGIEQTGAVNSAAISGNDVTVILHAAIAPSDTIVLSYVPGLNPIQDSAGNQAAELTDQPMINNTLGDSTVPVNTAVNLSGDIIDASVQYEYNSANQLRYIRMNTGEVYEFQYDENGNLVKSEKINESL